MATQSQTGKATMRDNRWYRRTWEPGFDLSRHQTEFATALRIPFLTDPFPYEYYRFGIVVNTDENALWRGEVPTDEEGRGRCGIRNAYFDYLFPQPDAFRVEMEAFAPYDIESGKPCHYFIKRSDGSWAYRRSQWTGAPDFLPELGDAPMTLAELIEHHSDLQWERVAQ